MDEIWERAVETALDGQTDVASVRTLTLDGAVKCVHGRLPPPALLEKFNNLQHLSVANIGISSLKQFPHLQNLQKLILSDNCIVGELEYLVEAGLESLRDLDLSNNRIQDINDLRPLAKLKLVLLDLIVDADEKEESDADEEETEMSRVGGGGKRGQSALVASPIEWFHVAAVDVEEDEEDKGEEDEDNDLVEEIDEDNGDDEDVVEVHEIDDNRYNHDRNKDHYNHGCCSDPYITNVAHHEASPPSSCRWDQITNTRYYIKMSSTTSTSTFTSSNRAINAAIQPPSTG
ncbi:hypothetical protein RJ640_004042 [Escallonia rubra]|uniref:Acidic leucine-rich nuclear phosphoprotein 32-related protein n=1 Tax=Escallonia rubra TaxID=112253 RepID=A0AA88R8M5_9ASTE|nr:hypothetical protein RJ640_004042 [Escallonia rubra]